MPGGKDLNMVGLGGNAILHVLSFFVCLYFAYTDYIIPNIKWHCCILHVTLAASVEEVFEI